MKLGKREYAALERWVRGQEMRSINADMRTAILTLNPDRLHKDLKSLGKDRLNLLIPKLPSGRMAHLHSPLLHSVRTKAKTSLAGLRIPHLDPESWPQAYRMQTRLNNSRAGIRKGPMGQYLRLNPKAMSIRLTSEIVWDQRNAGDLYIMGTWADISKMIADGGDGLLLASRFDDIYAGDVNVEHDRKYGSMPGDIPGGVDSLSGDMPLYVTVQPGALWKKSDDEGEVVLNAPKEIIELVAGRALGVAGQIPAATAQSVTLDTIGTVGPTLVEGGKKLLGMMTEKNPNKSLYTVTVGVGPVGERYSVADGPEISGPELLEIAEDLREL